MTLPISAIRGATLPDAVRPADRSSGGGFQEVLSNAIQNVETLGSNASDSIERFLSGEAEELHTTILAVQKAALSFEFFLQMRNKVVSAYQEIMRMPM